MMIGPKISVITVVFNGINSIEKTILNVLRQTYSNIEYIIVDGSSNDGTVEILKKYRSNLIYVSEKDRGIYDAMQKGAVMATGEWLIYRNCGDYFEHPNVIKEVFDEYEDNGEDFIFCDCRYFKEYGYKDIKPAILNRHYFECMPAMHPSSFIRRTTQLKYPFRLKYRNSADYCFFVESFTNGASYKYIPVTLSLFDNNCGVSTDSYDRSIIENIDILKTFGATDIQIYNLSEKLRDIKIRSFIRKYIPFYSFFHSYNLKNQGWIKATEKQIFKNI